MPGRHEITRADILPPAQYAAERQARRGTLIALKRHRRIEVGPHAILLFENYDTMWSQIHEMLFIEQGGDAQIDDELAAYNPLIPKGRELVATMMLEIDDPGRRARVLARLGGIETMVSLEFADDTVFGRPTDDGVTRSTSEGRTSSVHFLHFAFSPGQIEKFRQSGTQIIAAIRHPVYEHLAVMPEATRVALARDFD
jgi:hypothetical protein